MQKILTSDYLQAGRDWKFVCESSSAIHRRTGVYYELCKVLGTIKACDNREYWGRRKDETSFSVVEDGDEDIDGSLYKSCPYSFTCSCYYSSVRFVVINLLWEMDSRDSFRWWWGWWWRGRRTTMEFDPESTRQQSPLTKEARSFVKILQESESGWLGERRSWGALIAQSFQIILIVLLFFADINSTPFNFHILLKVIRRRYSDSASKEGHHQQLPQTVFCNIRSSGTMLIRSWMVSRLNECKSCYQWTSYEMMSCHSVVGELWVKKKGLRVAKMQRRVQFSALYYSVHNYDGISGRMSF